MWTRLTTSGSQEHPTPKDVVRAMLARMIEEAGRSSWAHFEVISEGGWFRNLLFGREPWVEVAYVDECSLQLNIGVCKKKGSLMPEIPERWKSSGKRLWTVPISDTEAVTDWVDACLAAVSERPRYRVTGWIEGL